MEKNMKKIWKKTVNNQSGMTLVELIVVFALVGIFMVAATFMLTASLRMFERMQGTSQAVTVSDLILDKISGEIAAAEIPEKDKAGYYFWLEKETDASWAAFCNRSGSPISMFAEGGELILKYYEMSSLSKQAAVNEINWRFDKNVYMNYKISDLRFSFPDVKNHPNVVAIDLTLKNQRTGFEYQTSRFAENYNFDSDYMLVRHKGGTGRPVVAEEFRITTDPDNPEKEMITYTVEHFLDGDSTPILTETLKAEKGAVDIYAYSKDSSFPGFSGYQANADKYLVDTQLSGQTYAFRYTPIPPVKLFDYTIRGHISSEYENYIVTDKSGDYSGSGSRLNWELYKEVRSAELEAMGTQATAPLWKGYKPVNPTYTIGQSWIEIPYIPDDVTVIIYAKCGDRILDTTTLDGKYDSTIDLDSKKNIEGYTLISANHAKILVDQIDGVKHTFYYSKNPANHPYTTVGPNVKVEVEPGEVPPELQKFGEAIADFFNSEWKKVGEDGYYKLYSDGDSDEISGIGGFASGDGNANKLIEAIKAVENINTDEKDDDFLFINNKSNGNTSTSGGNDAIEELLEHIAKEYGISGEYQELIADADAIHFDFNGTHLAKVTFKIDNPKRDVTITFFE